jgi:serine/threonine protein kinase
LEKFEEIDKKHFISEISLLLNLRHPLIVNFIGICQVNTNKFQIVTEYMKLKSLKHVLENRQIELTDKTKVNFCLDIAIALWYLHSRSPAVLHRDIKSSNCLVSDDLRIKLCDLGLSKVYLGRRRTETKSNTYWMSPESLLHDVYSEKSDIYSLGILFWEIMHRKTVPYDGLNETCFLFESQLKEIRPKIDVNILPKMKDLMVQCWQFEEDKRPFINEIVSKLESIKEDIK